ncbi:MAG: hypothetical protein PHD95_04715 [Candidatus ainarchaeum sp.]|nr:hypothetical protein [Candidatus ainarchaeum sp.]
MVLLVDFEKLSLLYPPNYNLNQDTRVAKWLPLYSSPELAALVADLMGDGHLQGPPKWRFDFCSKNVSELKRFENVLWGLFRVKGKIRDCTTNKYTTKNYGVTCKPLSRVLFLAGIPHGNKVTKDYSIPKWILDDKDCFAAFTRRYFDCEGFVDLGKKELEISISKSVELNKSAIAFLDSISFGLDKFYDIKTMKPFFASLKIKRKCGCVVQAARLKISRKQNLTLFYKNIGFDSKKKMEKLKLAIS